MTGVDTDLATLRDPFKMPSEHEAAVDRVEAELSRLREQRDALAEAQQFPVETVMSWKRRAESAERMIRYARVLLDPERQDEPDEENALRAYEALSGVPLSVEAGLPSAIRQLEAAETRCARLQQAQRQDQSAIALLLASVRVFLKHGDRDAIEGALVAAEENDWQHRSSKALAGPDTPADSQWFIPEGDRQCGVVHKDARATCMKRRGHDGSHGTPQGTWIDGPWCEYPADSQEEDKT